MLLFKHGRAVPLRRERPLYRHTVGAMSYSTARFAFAASSGQEDFPLEPSLVLPEDGEDGARVVFLQKVSASVSYTVCR